MNKTVSKAIAVILLFVIGHNSVAQTNADKDAFAETFIKIFQQRANGFDSISSNKNTTGSGLDAKVKFPGADICTIQYGKYVAEYNFTDSSSAISFFNTLQDWLNYAASAYKSRAVFMPMYSDPRQLKFYLSDSSGLIDADNYLVLSKNRSGKPFTIKLGIDSKMTMSYYISYGEKIYNMGINALIREVGFGDDLLMTKIKKNKKKLTEGYSYESVRTLPGYTAKIYEYTDEETEANENKLELVKKWSGQVKTVNQKVDSLILMLKAALPSSYCYYIDGEEQSVSFYQHPFTKEKHDAEFTIAYGLNEGKKDSYYLALIITRFQQSETEVEKEETIVTKEKKEIELYSFKDVNGKYGYRDANKKVIVSGKYDEAAGFRQGRARVVLNKKHGFIDITGKEIIPLKYDYASLYFFNGIADVGLYDKYGMIDVQGKEIIPLKYDAVDNDNSEQAEDFILVKLQGKWGLVDKTHREIVPIKYDYANIVTPARIRVSLNKKDGVIDSKGKEIIPMIYDAMNTDHYKSHGVLKVKLNEKWGLLDNTGKIIIPIKYNYTAYEFKEGLAWVNRDDKYGFVDKAGKEIIPLKYFSADNFSEGLAEVSMNRKWGFIDKTSKEIIALKYESSKSFANGLAAVQLNGKWGYVNKAGKEVIAFKYDRAEDFDKYGQAKVYIGKKWGKINTSGVIVKAIDNEDSDDDDEWY